MANTHPTAGLPQHQPTQRSYQPSHPRRLQLGSRQRYANDVPIDILQWLRENEPQDYSELQTLRRALCTRETTGHWIVRPRTNTAAGEERFVLVGRVSAVLFLSNKSRHFLLRNLNRLRKKRGWPPIVY
jgi:hypothetical protein